MAMNINAAAQRIGVSARRVRALIESGRLAAERVGSQWVLDEAEVARFEPARGRPLSARNARALLNLLDGREPIELSAKEKARIRARQRKLLADEYPAALLRSWLAGRERVLRSAAKADLAELRSSGEIVPSGVSDSRAGVAAPDLVEGYVSQRDLPSLEARWLLVPADERDSNVILHVVDEAPEVLGKGHIAADLAEHGGPREDRQVRALVSELR